MAAWQDLAKIYTNLGLWPDAQICAEKAKLTEFYSPCSWHTTGTNPVSMFVHACDTVNVHK